MLPRKRIPCLLITILLLIKSTEQHGYGAPATACEDQLPRHGSTLPQSSVPPYFILTSATQVRQGDTINVTLGSPAGAPVTIGGFSLQAREIQNTSVIVGQFVNGPFSISHLTNCSHYHDTATHNTPEGKSAITFVWEAPTDFLGGVEFRGTVAQGYDTFWSGVKSSLVEVVSPDTALPAPAAAPAAPTTTRAPPVTMETKPKPADAPLDVIYRGCTDNKLCFGLPENCVQKGNCQAVVAVFVAGDVYTFEVQGTGNPKYVAAGLSMDTKMGDDSAMECVQNDNGRVSLFASWTYPKSEPYVSRSDSPQDIVQMIESSVIEGKLYCKFRRDVVSTVKGVTFDLGTNRYNLMVLAGKSMKDVNRVGFHDIVYGATGSPLALASVGAAGGASRLLVRLHGSLMLAAWLGAASLGILLARYFRQTWVGKQIGGKDIWFAWHRLLMVGTWLLTMAGFIIIVVEAGGWSAAEGNPHAITGLVTVILCFLQPIGAYFRPHPGTKKRPIFNWVHWLFGNLAHILGIVTIFLAVYLKKADLPIWTVYILAAFVVFHVIMHLVLSLSACVSDGRISSGRVNSFPMKEMHARRATPVDRTTDAPFSGFRKLLLAVYGPIILLFTVAMICLVALAPIGQTYESVMGV